MSLDTTIGGATAESYADVTFADTYFAFTPRLAVWTAVGDDEAKEIQLREAMRFIEGLDYIGARASAAQALDFPRYGGVRYTITDTTDYETLRDARRRSYSAEAIPEPIKIAQCEMALALHQYAAAWTDDRYKRRIIRNAEGLIEFRTGIEVRLVSKITLLSLRPFLLRGMGSGRTMRA
jgi:hypothetical protein